MKNVTESEHLRRVRGICLTLPGTHETVSHGAPTFWAGKRTFAMFVDDHHNDGHVAVWMAAEPGIQAACMHANPKAYFRPPYVGVKGWVGVELTEVDDEELASNLTDSWRFITSKQAPEKTRARSF